MSLSSNKSGTSFRRPQNVHSGTVTPEEMAANIIYACLKVGIKPTAEIVAQGLGTIEAEGTFDQSNWGGDGEHIGPWAEESGFGSEQERLDPTKSTILAMERYKADGGFQQAWWQWESGETEGTGQQRAHKYTQIAQRALLNFAKPSGGGPIGAVESGVSAVSGAITSAEDFLTELASTLLDFRKLGQLAAEAIAWLLRLILKAIWDYVIAPLWHWAERAVMWYWNNFFGTGTERGSGIGFVLRQNAMIITIIFWGLGYAILWSDGTSAFPVSPNETVLGRTVKGVEGKIARRNLVKPKDVEEKTPTKPKPKVSSVNIQKVTEFSVNRKRPVTVTGPGTQQGKVSNNGSSQGRSTHRVPKPESSAPPREGQGSEKKIILPSGIKPAKAQNAPKQRKTGVGT